MTNQVRKISSMKSFAEVSQRVKDYGTEPFFIQKAKESKAFIEKHGFPKELVRKK